MLTTRPPKPSVKIVTNRASPLGIPRDIYRGRTQFRVKMSILDVVVRYDRVVVAEMLWKLISFRLILKRVEDVAEEA
jgi:hypothetical protein